VFVLRRGGEVDPGSDQPKAGEARHRLWSMGALALAARLARLSAPAREDRSGLLVLRRPMRRRIRRR
jgi:hypothetical protein